MIPALGFQKTEGRAGVRHALLPRLPLHALPRHTLPTPGRAKPNAEATLLQFALTIVAFTFSACDATGAVTCETWPNDIGHETTLDGEKCVCEGADYGSYVVWDCDGPEPDPFDCVREGGHDSDCSDPGASQCASDEYTQLRRSEPDWCKRYGDVGSLHYVCDSRQTKHRCTCESGPVGVETVVDCERVFD